MTDGLKPYPEYRGSGQTWLGSVPRHWPVLPNRALFAEVKDRGHADEEMLSVTITRGIVPQKALLSDSSKKDSSRLDKSAYKLVQPRDIAYNKMRAWQGAIAVSDLRGIVSPAYIVMRLREEQNARYFHHLYRTPQFAKEAERWSYGITSDMWSLRPEHFKMIYSARPPRDEQDAIVRFLDHANARIERAIRAKKQLIALLQEQKQAIIHRAVTRGLDPNVSRKPSGIAWLGDIPQHWEVGRLGSLSVKMTNGFVGPTRDILVENGVRYLQSLHIKDGKIIFTKPYYVRKAWSQRHPRSILRTGDVLLVQTGDIGQVAVVPLEFEGCNCHALIVVTPNSQMVTGQYLAVVLNSEFGFNALKVVQTGATLPHLNCRKVKDVLLPLPPEEEQLAVLQEIDATNGRFAPVIGSTEREISLLREYRTRLVADAVTGKLDLRDAAAKLRPSSVESFGETDIEEPSEEDELVEAEV